MTTKSTPPGTLTDSGRRDALAGALAGAQRSYQSLILVSISPDQGEGGASARAGKFFITALMKSSSVRLNFTEKSCFSSRLR